ncbi:MAG: 50S ribosomal protein L22 [Candidatus Omnitrophota bacterium]
MIKVKREIVARAHERYLRISPRKVRYVIDLIRGEAVPKAMAMLGVVNRGAAKPVQKALKSVLSNALRNPTVKSDELIISTIMADSGPMLKRFRAAAMGRATSIRHRTTHLFIELSRIIKKEAKPETQKKTAKTKTRK